MTDKRFRVETIEEELYPMPVYYDGNKKLGYVEIIHLLNKLHEENTMLKERRHEDINDLSVIAMKYKALEKENKQLKQYKEAIWDCDSSKIIRVNKNTGEVDLIDKELEE